MGLPVGRLEALSRDMRVNLRGGRGGMAKDLLHAAQVGAPFKQVSSRGMPDGVRTRVLDGGGVGPGCGPGIRRLGLPLRPGRRRAARACTMRRAVRGIEPDRRGRRGRGRRRSARRRDGLTRFRPAATARRAGRTDRDDPFLAALAERPDRPPSLIKAAQVELA